jgi:hypothetical protein
MPRLYRCTRLIHTTAAYAAVRKRSRIGSRHDADIDIHRLAPQYGHPPDPVRVVRAGQASIESGAEARPMTAIHRQGCVAAASTVIRPSRNVYVQQAKLAKQAAWRRS